MTPGAQPASLDDVLDAYAMEPTHGRETLDRFIQLYPEHALALIDLSRELTRMAAADDSRPLSAEEEGFVEAAWQRHISPAPLTQADPLASLPLATLRQLAKSLDVPRQVITAFLDRKVIIASVPKWFIARMADCLQIGVEQLTQALTSPPDAGLARSYKADEKPIPLPAVTFERILVDAGVPEPRLAQLLADAG